MQLDDRLFVYDKSYSGDEMLLPCGKIVQIAELSLVAGGTIPEHCQVCDEITYVVSGSAVVYSDGVSHTLRSGEIHYIKKDVKHKIIADSERNFRYICIGFVPEVSCRVIQPFLQSVETSSCRFWTDDGNVRILSEMLVNEVYTADAHSNAMIDMYICQILLTLCRDSAPAAPDRSRKNEVFTIYHVLRYIDREYMNIEDIRQISEKLNYSYHYLSHLFSSKMGQSIKEYVTEKKLTEAARLVRSENLTAEQLAERVGYSSGRTFAAAFKKHFGVSIGEYKRKF